MSCPEHAEYPIRGVASPRTVRRPGVSCEGQMAQSRRNVGGGPSVGHVSPPSTCPRRSRAPARGPSRPTPCQRGGDHVGRARRRDRRGLRGRCDDHRRPGTAMAVTPTTARDAAGGSLPVFRTSAAGRGLGGYCMQFVGLERANRGLGFPLCSGDAPAECGRRLCRQRRRRMAVRAGGDGFVIFVTTGGEFAAFHAIRGAEARRRRGWAASAGPEFVGQVSGTGPREPPGDRPWGRKAR
jgi:hypothetical protein